MARVLIVEDEAILAMNTRLFLESKGHDVVGVAATGEQALELLAREEPELAFMDIVLHGDLSGIDITKIINDKYDTKVVYMTAHSDENTINLANQTRHFGFIFKPFEDNQLIETLHKVLEQ